MAKQSQIKWKKGDAIRLGKAVSRFNKIRNQLLNSGLVEVPETYDYKDLCNSIKTRKELNRMIDSLKSFGKEGSMDIVELPSGQRLTVWEYNQLNKARNRIRNRLKREYIKLDTPKLGEKYSRVQMGSQRASVIRAQLEKLDTLEDLKNYDFLMYSKKIFYQGRYDYSMRKAIVFRENYIKVMEKYRNFDNYDLLMNKLKSITNPLKFYEFVSADEITIDLNLQSQQVYAQQAFNSFLIRLGFNNIDDVITKEYDLKL